MELKGYTITMKIEVDLQGIPPEKIPGADIAIFEKSLQELKEEMTADLADNPELASHIKVSVDVERHEEGKVDIERPEMDIEGGL